MTPVGDKTSSRQSIFVREEEEEEEIVAAVNVNKQVIRAHVRGPAVRAHA